jgi:hypothetical protein
MRATATAHPLPAAAAGQQQRQPRAAVRSSPPSPQGPLSPALQHNVNDAREMKVIVPAEPRAFLIRGFSERLNLLTGV